MIKRSLKFFTFSKFFSEPDPIKFIAGIKKHLNDSIYGEEFDIKEVKIFE